MEKLKTKHKEEISDNDVLKRKNKLEYSKVIGSYKDLVVTNKFEYGEIEYLMFWGYSIPRKHLHKFFETKHNSIVVYDKEV